MHIDYSGGVTITACGIVLIVKLISLNLTREALHAVILQSIVPGMNTKWLLQFIQTVAEVGTNYVELDLWRTEGQDLFAFLFDPKKCFTFEWIATHNLI